MYRDFMYEIARERMAECLAEAEGRRWCGASGSAASWRARAARRFFELAFFFDAEESWRAVWDKMGGARPPGRRLRGEKGPVG